MDTHTHTHNTHHTLPSTPATTTTTYHTTTTHYTTTHCQYHCHEYCHDERRTTNDERRTTNDYPCTGIKGRGSDYRDPFAFRYRCGLLLTYYRGDRRLLLPTSTYYLLPLPLSLSLSLTSLSLSLSPTASCGLPGPRGRGARRGRHDFTRFRFLDFTRFHKISYPQPTATPPPPTNDLNTPHFPQLAAGDTGPASHTPWQKPRSPNPRGCQSEKWGAERLCAWDPGGVPHFRATVLHPGWGPGKFDWRAADPWRGSELVALGPKRNCGPRGLGVAHPPGS